MVSYDAELTVAWGDCDAAGISYYAKNFEWYTDAYMQMLDHYELPYMETFHHQGISIVCLKADTEYKKMVLPLEKLTVRTVLTQLTRTRLEFSYQVIKADGTMASVGKTSHAFVNNDGRPLNLQKHFPELWGRLMDKMAENNGDERLHV